MSENLTIIKLGGALLTDKQRPYTLRPSILAQAAREIKTCLDQGLIDKLLLVHGVGAFGHPPVVQHNLHKGFQSPAQLIHLTGTQNRVMELRLAIAAAFHEAGIAVNTIFPSSCMAASGFVHKESYLTAVAGFLELGMVPLLGGDVLVDDQAGFSVYGGDQIAVQLALHFNASCLIFATEVDGLYDKDPQRFPSAQRIEQFDLRAENGVAIHLDDRRQVDASGAMAGKLTAVRQAQDAISSRLQVRLISMMRPGNLLAVLRGEQGIGTLIT